ncbi:hypothetical protein SCA6_007406 [Theobroma cacao]
MSRRTEVSSGVKRRRFAGVHGTRPIDYIGVTAPRSYDLLKSLIIQLTGNVKVEILLVYFQGFFQLVIEIVAKICRRVGDITEVVKVLFELGQAVSLFARLATGEFLEGIPRGE